MMVRLSVRRSDAEALPLAAKGATQVGELGADESVDPVAGFADRLADALLDLLRRDAVEQLAAARLGPAGAGRCAGECLSSGPLGAAKDRSDRPLPGGAASEHEGCRGAD